MKYSIRVPMDCSLLKGGRKQGNHISPTRQTSLMSQRFRMKQYCIVWDIFKQKFCSLYSLQVVSKKEATIIDLINQWEVEHFGGYSEDIFKQNEFHC